VKGRVPLPGSAYAATRRARRIAARKSALTGSAALITLLLATPLQAQEISDPSNIFGSRGLMGTPSARMAPDGELSVSASFMKNTQHYNFGFQVMPWLEATFRYSGLQHFQADFPVYYDRAFGIKARLWDEGTIIPAVAVGIDDIIGTGIYTGEYLVASKRFGDIDTSLGLGWGRLAGAGLLRNPLALVIPSFDNRHSYFGQAGGADFTAFFHGHNVGLFGGAVWHTPLDGLALMVEYDSDTYAQEKAFGNFSPRSQVNYGLTYTLSEQTAIGLDWLYGTTLGGNFSLRLDPVHPQYPQNGLQARLFEDRAANRNAFVDALWRQGGDYADIQVRQNTLDLTVTGAISSTRCAATARLMQGVTAHISQVGCAIRTGGAASPAWCRTRSQAHR
jgi:hypothetical protein